MQLVVDEVISETLESDNLVLQNLGANKHVQVPSRINYTLLSSHCTICQGVL